MANATTPTSRLVMGDPCTLVLQKDRNGAQKKNKDGTDMAQAVLAFAISKTDPAWPAFRQKLLADDRAAWPQFFDAAGNLLPGVKFADKIIDGDGFDSKGQPYSRREGYAGCWVVKAATGYLPRVVMHDGRGWVDAPPNFIKTGDYVMAEISSTSNQSTETPGMYRNLQQVAFVGHGAPIIMAGTDPNEAFGSAPVPLPPGATAMPQAPGAPPPAAAPYVPPAAAAPAPVAAPPPAAAPYVPPAAAAPAPVAAPPSPAAASPAPADPYLGYAQPAPAPAAPAPAPAAPAPAPAAPAPAPAAPVMTATATTTYDAYIAAGWTEAQLISSGFMLPR